MKLIAYHRPAALAEARHLLRELGPAAMPLAGCTSHSFVKGDEERIGVDLARIGFDTIERADGGFIVGANARVADLQAHRAPGWVLDRVALRFVSQPVRNMTTLGGNIARIFPWNDFPVALLALNATVAIAGEEERQLPADIYFDGQPARHFKAGDILIRVFVPDVGAGCGFAYRKDTLVSMAFSRLTAAVWLQREGKTIRDARIALGAAVPLPLRLELVEEAVVGKVYSAELIANAMERQIAALRWRSSDAFSEEYVQQLARVHVPDALEEAYRAAGGGRK